MNTKIQPPSPHDPLRTLGLPLNATQPEIRARYVELIKQFPPEREPQRFQQIQQAFQLAKDPLALARTLLQPPSNSPPNWNEVIEKEESNPPPMSVDLLLSLGNCQERRDEAKPASNTPQ